jgi:hypothetical protein
MAPTASIQVAELNVRRKKREAVKAPTAQTIG